MRGYFFVEFVTQDDYVLKVGREHFLGRVTVVPNLGLAKEIKPGALDDARTSVNATATRCQPAGPVVKSIRINSPWRRVSVF